MPIPKISKSRKIMSKNLDNTHHWQFWSIWAVSVCLWVCGSVCTLLVLLILVVRVIWSPRNRRLPIRSRIFIQNILKTSRKERKSAKSLFLRNLIFAIVAHKTLSPLKFLPTKLSINKVCMYVCVCLSAWLCLSLLSVYGCVSLSVHRGLCVSLCVEYSNYRITKSI